jgi:FtsP/CotA-like multicopper oxidase with cupredoxin domain
LNGKSFPYTVRESIVAAERNESYRLRTLNTGTRPMSIHTHGHKFTIEAYDGVELDESQEIQRDVLSITTAQRVDLTLNTTVDGLNSYGEGLWLAHDHRESGVTTDGISPGGTITMIAYEDYLDERGVPRTDTNLSRYFSETYYDGEIPYWGRMDPAAFGEPPGSNGTAGGDGADESAANGSDAGGSSGHDHGSGNDDHGAGTGTGDGTATSDGANADGGMDMDGDGMNGSDTNASGNASGGMDMGGDGMDMGGGDGMMGGGMMMDMSMVPNGTVINANPDELPPGCEAVSGERTVTVKGGEEWAAPGEAFAFSTEEFAFDRCERVTVTFENHDDVRHQWMVHGLPTETYPMGMFNLEARQQGSVTGTFITPAENGRLELHCSLPQHEQKGMHAAIAVGSGRNETGDGDGHGHDHGDGGGGSNGSSSGNDTSVGRAGLATTGMTAAAWAGVGLLAVALLIAAAILIRR